MGGRLDPAVAAVRRAVRLACSDLEPGQQVVVACSGGADSMALAAATVFESRSAGWSVGAAIVDHQIQSASAKVAADVAHRLAAMGCDPVDVLPVNVGHEGGPEAAARMVRYEALATLAARHDAVVLLGHTRDDQAETVLLGLMRGSGLRSLAGMPASRGSFRRPLLHVSRTETAQACAAMDLEPWQDPHNDDERFARVRARKVALPVLEQTLGPGVADALVRTAEQARDDADALDTLADLLAERALTPTGTMSVAVLATSLPALRRRVLRQQAIAAGCPAGELSAVHVEAVDRLVTHWHGQRGIDLPGHVVARRESAELRFARSSRHDR